MGLIELGFFDPSAGLFLILLTAFVGSWHCAGMCGPVALLMGRGRAGLYYQLGRGLGYAGLGLLAGATGDQLLYRIQGLQHSGARFAVAVVAALLLGVSAARLLRPVRERMPRLVRGLPPALRPWGMGLATAAFPCGWLWSFVAAAAATGRPATGAVVMLALWLGGLPALTFFAGLQKFLWRHVPAPYRPYLAGLLWVAGVWGLVSHLLLHHPH